MKRGEIGRYETTRIAGEESVRTFVPHPLPPDPSVVLDASLQQTLEAAEAAIANLNQAFETSTDRQSLHDHLVRQEATAASQIEGIRVSLDDLQRHEEDGSGTPNSMMWRKCSTVHLPSNTGCVAWVMASCSQTD